MGAIKNEKKEEYNQYKNDVVNGFLKSFAAITEHYSIKEYAYKINLNSSTVTTWVRKYIEELQSSFKVELENSSLRELNKKNKRMYKEKVKLEKEIDYFKNDKQLLKDDIDYLRNDKKLLEEEINILKKDNELLKEKINFIEKNLEKNDLLKLLILVMNKIVE
jgi:transposase-like protein